MRGYELGRIHTPALGVETHTPFSPERTMPCPQTWFDPILQNHARSFPQVTLRHRVKLESFVQDENGVTASLTDGESDRSETVRAKYLVGCDGFGSTVRELLGIDIRGALHIDWAMTVYLRIPDLHAQHDKGKGVSPYVFVGPEGTWSFLTIVDGKDLWRLQLVDLDEDRLHKADIPALMRRAMGGDVAYTIEHKDWWGCERARSLTVFMDGRVFLAGDSAHAHPPNGGLGMNTGIQDAFDLGWKLAAMLDGWGGEALLESYDTERRPASARAAEASLRNYRRLISAAQRGQLYAAPPQGAAARRASGEQMVEEHKKSWHPVGVHLGYIYHPSPIVVPDGSPKPADDTFGYQPTTFPGARAPHVWLAPGRSTLDLFRRHLRPFEIFPACVDRRDRARRGQPRHSARRSSYRSWRGRGALRARPGAGSARRPRRLARRQRTRRCAHLDRYRARRGTAHCGSSSGLAPYHGANTASARQVYSPRPFGLVDRDVPPAR